MKFSLRWANDGKAETVAKKAIYINKDRVIIVAIIE